MAQINLLKQQNQTKGFVTILPSLVAKLLAVAVIGLGVYYGWVSWRVNDLKKSIASNQQQFVDVQKSVVTVKNRNEIYTRQQQLKQFAALLGAHLYWSNFFPALAQVTLQSANYGNIEATKAGELTLNVQVKDLNEMDKFMQVFNLPQFNKDFNYLKVDGFRLVQKDKGTFFEFNAKLKFNPALLQYKKDS